MSPESQSAVLTVLERLPISAVISSLENGLILWVNAWNVQLAGATQQRQIVGHNLLEFLEPDQHGIALRDIEAISRGETPPPVVYKLRRLDGGRADVQISSILLRWEGQPAMLSLVADVTDRERDLRALAESEERYRRLVEDSLDGLVVVAGDRVVYANKSLLTALGAEEPETLLGKSMYDFIAPADRKDVRTARKRVLLTGEPHLRSEVTLVRLDGSRLPTTAQTTVVRWDGEIATQTVIRDIASVGRQGSA